MAKTLTSQKDETNEMSRRALIKWSLAAGAALGVPGWKIVEIIEKTGGKEVAFAAAQRTTTRSISFQAGNGGLSWCTLLWPHYKVALDTSGKFAYQSPGKAALVTGTDQPLALGPDSPFKNFAPNKQITAFTAGNNQTHTQNATSTNLLNNNSIFAVFSALQASSPTVVPTIVVGQEAFGTAPGSATPTAVATPAGMVSLFNSAASRAGGMLSQATDAQLYNSQYQAYIQLNRASSQPTTRTGYTTAIGAAGFLGENLAAKLTLTADDQARYLLNTNLRANVAAIATTLATAVKMFQLNLTNSLLAGFMLDDPHGAFDNNDVATVPGQLGAILDAFAADMSSTLDSVTGTPLINDLVMTFQGDTHKNSLTPGGWPDGTAGNHNVIYVLGGGTLKTGWFGNLDTTGKITGFDANGAAATYNGATQATIALAAAAFAVAKGDSRAIQGFANGTAIVPAFGNLKVT